MTEPHGDHPAEPVASNPATGDGVHAAMAAPATFATERAFADWPGGPPWQPLPEAALRSFRAAALLTVAVIALGVSAIPLSIGLLDEEPGLSPRLLWTAVPIVFALIIALWRANAAYRNTRWRLDEDGLRVRRGGWWRREILIPRARVQHLDVERGPIERRYGLATLVVHTAGTRINALRQPGFDEDSAARLRDALVPKQREMDVPIPSKTAPAVADTAPSPLATAASAESMSEPKSEPKSETRSGHDAPPAGDARAPA